MAFFKDRSDYFKTLASLNKQVAHNRSITVPGNGPGADPVDTGGRRKSYHRLNNEEELAAACANWAHFPCVVHFGYAGQYTEQTKTEVKKRNVLNDLVFLAKASSTDMAAIETAKDTAFTIMESFMKKMVNDSEEEGYCGPFANIDLSMFSFSEHGPVNSTLYGWRLTFNDETFVDDSDDADWYEV